VTSRRAAAPEADGREAPTRRSLLGFLERLLRGVLPAEDGGPPPALDAARARLSVAVAVAFGLLLGAAVGLVLLLVATGVPQVPALVAGFGVGALLGAAAAAVLLSRFPAVRAGGGLLILLAPLLVLLAPFLLLAGAVVALRRWPRRSRGAARSNGRARKGAR
jgi:hypothetical protein